MKKDDIETSTEVESITSESSISSSVVQTASYHDETTEKWSSGDLVKNKIDSSSEIMMSYQTAFIFYLLTVLFAGIFCACLYFYSGPVAAQEFVVGYLIEQSLSMDNLLVFLALFNYFKIPTEFQSKLLSWGIIGAIIMRLTIIMVGGVIVSQFQEVLLIFAAFLVYSSGHMLYAALRDSNIILGTSQANDDEEEEEMESNWIVRCSKSILPVTDKFHGNQFFAKETNGNYSVATPLFVCMIAIELSDIVFAVDSIPAVFGVTQDPFVIFSSNIFAIVGLRSLFIILSKAANDLKYLEPSVAIVLGFIGIKMIVEYFGTEVPTAPSLGFIVTMLSGGCFLSLWGEEYDVIEDGKVGITNSNTSEDEGIALT